MRSPILALIVAAAFGCTTLRAPAGSVDAALTPAAGIVTDPQVELWLESTDVVPQQEADAAQQQAWAVLATAIAERPIRTARFDAMDPIVVVRERAVARTGARKNAQTAAKVGIIVAFVAVAVAAVFVIIKGAHGGNASSAQTAAAKAPPKVSAKAAPAAAGAAARMGPAAAPRVAPRTAPIPNGPVRPRPIPVRPVPLAPGPPPAYFGPPVYVAAPWNPWIVWNFGIWVDLTPHGYPAQAAEPPAPPDAIDGRIAAAPPPPEDDEVVDSDAEPPPALELPPFAAPDVEHRGFFDGDEIRLQVAVLDRATGRLLWVNETKTDGDPRNRADIEHALDSVFAGTSWAAR